MEAYLKLKVSVNFSNNEDYFKTLLPTIPPKCMKDS